MFLSKFKVEIKPMFITQKMKQTAITSLLKSLDFKTIDIFGAKLGAFSSNDKLSTEDYEMLVIAEK